MAIDLISELHKPVTPKIQAVYDRRKAIAEPGEKLKAVTLERLALEKGAEVARTVAMRDSSLDNVRAYVAKRREAQDFTEVERELYGSVGWAKSELAGYGSDAADILLAALKEMRDRTAKRIKSINDAMELQARELGLEPAEHSGLQPLRVYLSALADAIVAHADYGSGNCQSFWERFHWHPIAE